METNGIGNRHQLNDMLDMAFIILGQLFRTEWRDMFGHDWNKDKSNTKVLLGHVSLKKISTQQRQNIKNGDVSLWDMTLLRVILTAKDLLKLSKEKKRHVHRLSEIRNKIPTSASSEIPDDDIRTYCHEVTAILSDFEGTTNIMLNDAQNCLSNGDPQQGLHWCNTAKAVALDSHLLRIQQIEEQCALQIQQFHRSGVRELETLFGLSENGSSIRQRYDRCFAAEQNSANSIWNGWEDPPQRLDSSSFPILQQSDIETHAEHSTYAKQLLRAQNHFYTSLNALKKLHVFYYYFPTPLLLIFFYKHVDWCREFVSEFAKCVQIEYLVAQLTIGDHTIACQSVTTMLNLGIIDEETLVCFIALKNSSKNESSLQHLDKCIKWYPQNSYFVKTRCCLYAFLGQYKKGIQDANTAITLDPLNCEAYYYLAEQMRQFPPNQSAKKVIEAFQNFLFRAPCDHYKVPEAHYQIAELYISMFNFPEQNANIIANVKRYFGVGVKAEKIQLPIFLPYSSDTKHRVEEFLRNHKINTVDKTAQPTVEKHESSNPIEAEDVDTNINPSETDQYRTKLIIDHRLTFRDCNQQPPKNKMKACPNPKPQKSETIRNNLKNLQEITLQDMDQRKEKNYIGFIISVTIIDVIIFTGQSMLVIIEDAMRDVQRCAIYNWGNMSNRAECRKTFGPGCRMKIMNPCMKMGRDEKFLIEVEDPSSIKFNGYLKRMCRYCCKENAKFKCPECKVNYCNEGCKSSDWKKQRHEAICRRDIR